MLDQQLLRPLEVSEQLQAEHKRSQLSFIGATSTSQSCELHFKCILGIYIKFLHL